MRFLLSLSNRYRVVTIGLFVVLLMSISVIVVLAQDESSASVDDIVSQLYYEDTMSVTNYEPTACVQWRSVSRPDMHTVVSALLADGKTEEQIIYEFVSCFGYRVIGITDDDVNNIAEQLYCPVCENIPLETCGTAACRDWRNEIGIYLLNGMTEDEIIDDFVLRFGDRVVGTPKDPTLRALSLVTPWVLVGLMLAAAAYTYTRWSTQEEQDEPFVGAPVGEVPPKDEDYLARLEKDLGSED
jgi:cytochrome c-type biogenesis protein CcmH